VQRPHPPILIGGEGPTVLERVLEYGDGWLPNAHPEVEARTRELHRLAAERGHAPPEVTVIHTEPDVEVVRAYAVAGVARCLFSLPSAGEAETVAHLEQFRHVVEEYRAGR
jgi:alkanesulfonate monooxygenase SsuD/methylene tetrahydromethanopterin reductase-like flavin-dependent oxidoreductase (luciferase family)